MNSDFNEFFSSLNKKQLDKFTPEYIDFCKILSDELAYSPNAFWVDAYDHIGFTYEKSCSGDGELLIVEIIGISVLRIQRNTYTSMSKQYDVYFMKEKYEITNFTIKEVNELIKKFLTSEIA